MAKFRVELDGPVGQGVIVRDGEALTNVTALAVFLDPNQQVQSMNVEHTLIHVNRAYVAVEQHTIVKATLLIETVQEA